MPQFLRLNVATVNGMLGNLGQTVQKVVVMVLEPETEVREDRNVEEMYAMDHQMRVNRVTPNLAHPMVKVKLFLFLNFAPFI